MINDLPESDRQSFIENLYEFALSVGLESPIRHHSGVSTRSGKFIFLIDYTGSGVYCDPEHPVGYLQHTNGFKISDPGIIEKLKSLLRKYKHETN